MGKLYKMAYGILMFETQVILSTSNLKIFKQDQNSLPQHSYKYTYLYLYTAQYRCMLVDIKWANSVN